MKYKSFMFLLMLVVSAVVSPVCYAAEKTSELARDDVRIISRLPRDVGFVIGDQLTQVLVLTVPEGATLDKKLLPVAGPLSSAVTLRNIDVLFDESTHSYQFTLSYQLFAQVEHPQNIRIPQMPIWLDSSESLLLPHWDIGYAPLLNAASDELDIAPRAPLRYALQATLKTIYLCAAVLLFSTLLWLWLSGRWMFFRRKLKPFACARIRIRKLSSHDAMSCEKAFTLFQEAVWKSAGKVLFPDQLPDFFAQHQHYQPLATSIEQLLKQGTQARFRISGSEYPELAHTRQLCQRLYVLEQSR